mmetsp:Transcript_32518/g.105033  ORF Transcript_32518/g.105033 Transcript_32518/m.105033 type:complete len:260 (-) Transcript_32518:203-982(-)
MPRTAAVPCAIRALSSANTRHCQRGPEFFASPGQRDIFRDVPLWSGGATRWYGRGRAAPQAQEAHAHRMHAEARTHKRCQRSVRRVAELSLWTLSPTPLVNGMAWSAMSVCHMGGEQVMQQRATAWSSHAPTPGATMCTEDGHVPRGMIIMASDTSGAGPGPCTYALSRFVHSLRTRPAKRTCCGNGSVDAPRDATELVRRFNTKKAAMGDRSRPPIAGMTPRKRLRYKSDTVKTGRRSATLCACGTHESRMRSVIIPP